MHIKIILRGKSKQLYANKFLKLDEIKTFVRYERQKLTQEEADNGQPYIHLKN